MRGSLLRRRDLLYVSGVGVGCVQAEDLAEAFHHQRRAPDDRRRHIVEVTARGRAAIESIAQAVSAVERELFANLDPAGVALLRDLLNRVRADIRKACAAAKQPDPSAGTRSAPAWHY